MKIMTSTFIVCALTSLTIFFSGGRSPSPIASAQASDQLVYADFEEMKEGRPVSSRGGWIQLQGGQENPTVQAKFKGLEGTTNAPELVRLKPDDPNRAATFSYQLTSPNQYASVTLSIHGLPDKDGKPMGEDVSAYKFISFQIYSQGTPKPTGVERMRVELVSRGQGINLAWGYPRATFKLSPTGFNTYKIPLKSLAQSQYAPERVDLKEVLKKLTEVDIDVYCEPCVPISGVVVIDNVTFTN
jgi:hypothetical protein